MKSTVLGKMVLAVLAILGAVMSTSCGTLPQKPEHKGPVSSESTLPWNTPLPGEGQGALGGLQ